MKALPQDRSKIMRIVLLVLIVLILVCLFGFLLYNLLLGGGNEVTANTPTPGPSPTPTGIQVIVTLTEEPTPTPTRVVIETPTPMPAEETPTPIEEPTATTMPTPPASLVPIISSGAIEDLFKNGDFESGFDPSGVALDWHSFNNDSAVVSFSPETDGPYIKSGNWAQRITLAQATQPNRYAGLYQQVNIAPGQTYTLTMYGQIRTGLGDINQSSYGYRMQYAVDRTGGTNWQDVPESNWVELPWDEQLLNSADVKFLEYTTAVTSTSSKITLFVRAWKKWADPGEGQYTLDDLSLVGPVPGSKPVTPEAMIDQPLPTTGAGDSTGFIGSGRFWGAVLVLLLLAVGAIYRARWSY